MDFVSNAASLNRDAIQYLLMGNSSGAFATFRGAIQLLSHCSNTDRHSLAETGGVALVHCSTIGQIPLERLSKDFQPGMPFAQGNILVANLYEFSPEGQELSTDLLAYYSAIIIYNCALCLHQKGSPATMAKASILYLQCLDLIEPLQLDCPTLLVSILQNQANIYYNLNDFHSVRYTMDKLFLVTQRNRILGSAVVSDAVTIAPEA
jgi:hypothetical protein